MDLQDCYGECYVLGGVEPVDDGGQIPIVPRAEIEDSRRRFPPNQIEISLRAGSSDVVGQRSDVLESRIAVVTSVAQQVSARVAIRDQAQSKAVRSGWVGRRENPDAG
jgi:hypothetical protein